MYQLSFDDNFLSAYFLLSICSYEFYSWVSNTNFPKLNLCALSDLESGQALYLCIFRLEKEFFAK